ncbi:NAD(P)/FAD-dependent oxidoreductase [Dactylosporangium sp. CA-139114]|uniref:NAD(P)/FAD-dependent oxidoreductase n=1 Tax=Dactylosporangium sp. CA-139114 TaxID=3239931 RepID=UPI003D9739F3
MTAGRLVVVGGGVIGCAVALAAREQFAEIVIVEQRADLGLAASGAAIGGITPQSDDFCRGPLRIVAEASRAMYRGWLDDIESLSGVTVPYLDTGLLQVALSVTEEMRLREGLVPEWRAQGFTVEDVDLADLRRDEPLLSPEVVCAFRLPSEGALEPRVLMRALGAAIDRTSTITVRTGQRVDEVRPTATGVIVRLGQEQITADKCVVSAGAWSADLVPGISEAVFPVRGQAAEFRVPGAVTYPFRHHVYAKAKLEEVSHSAYIVPRSDGRVIAGVTYDEQRWDEEPTAESSSVIIKSLLALVPSASGWEPLSEWAGIRPATVDGCPLVGYVDNSQRRLVIATGHFGVGITLAPVTGQLVAALLSDEPLSEETQKILRTTDPSRLMSG